MPVGTSGDLPALSTSVSDCSKLCPVPNVLRMPGTPGLGGVQGQQARTVLHLRLLSPPASCAVSCRWTGRPDTVSIPQRKGLQGPGKTYRSRDMPAIPTIFPSGTSTSIFFRLWTRAAPRISILSFMCDRPFRIEYGNYTLFLRKHQFSR